MRIHRLLFAATAALALGSATKADTIYTDQATFLANVLPGYYLETFDSLPQGELLAAPLGFSGNGFAYTATATSEFFNVGPVGDTWLSTNDAYTVITFTFTGAPVTAVGGEFFVSDINGTVVPGTITATLANGTTQSLDDPTATSFIGFIATAPIVSMTLTVQQATPFLWATANNLIVGAAVPEPSAVVLLGVGLGGLLVARIRRSRRAAA